MPEPTTHHTLRVAAVQSTVRRDPTDADALRESGAEVRAFQRKAAEAGARLVHFAEGALCFPSKYVMSELGADEVGNSDWSKAQWQVLDEQLAGVAAVSAELGMDAHIPEIFIDYVRQDADAVLLSYATSGLSQGQDAVAAVAPANAAINHYWLSLAVSTNPNLPETAAGILNSSGQWVAQCPLDATPALTTYDLHKENTLNDSARAWRQAARTRVTS
jgi:hypothetical protein